MEGMNSKVCTFATAFRADNALLLTSLESSCKADTIGERTSKCAAVFEGSLWTRWSKSLPNAFVEVSRTGNCMRVGVRNQLKVEPWKVILSEWPYLFIFQVIFKAVYNWWKHWRCTNWGGTVPKHGRDCEYWAMPSWPAKGWVQTWEFLKQVRQLTIFHILQHHFWQVASITEKPSYTKCWSKVQAGINKSLLTKLEVVMEQ